MKPIVFIAVDSGCSKDLRARAAKLVADISDHAELVRKFQADRTEYNTRPIEGMSLGEGEAFQLRETAILIAEFKLRDRVTEVLDAERAEVAGLSDTAFKVWQAEAEMVRQAFLGMGYHEVATGAPDPVAMTPDMIARNPKVYNAKARAEELRNKSNDRSLLQRNKEEQAETKMKLDKLRARLAAV